MTPRQAIGEGGLERGGGFRGRHWRSIVGVPSEACGTGAERVVRT